MISLNKSLQTILNYRYLAIGGQLLAVLVAHYFLNIDLVLAPIFLIFFISLTVTISSRLFKSESDITYQHIYYQLLFDTLSFTALLYFTGGIQNPFTGLYLIQVIIAAIMLPALYTWLIVTISTLSYISLSFIVPMSHHHHHMMQVNWHLQGMIVSYIISALLVAILIGQLVREHRKQAIELENTQFKLKQESLLGEVGLLAADAVHQLSTPLSTIGLISTELKDEIKDQELHKLLQKQVERSTLILDDILLSFGTLRADHSKLQTLSEYILELQNEIQTQFPRESIRVSQIETNNSTRLYIPNILNRAIFNIISNAVKAYKETISIKIDYINDSLTISVQDDGPGIPVSVINELNSDKNSLNLQKKGLGLFLTQTIINKLNGTISYNTSKGTIVDISIPIIRETE